MVQKSPEASRLPLTIQPFPPKNPTVQLHLARSLVPRDFHVQLWARRLLKEGRALAAAPSPWRGENAAPGLGRSGLQVSGPGADWDGAVTTLSRD